MVRARNIGFHNRLERPDVFRLVATKGPIIANTTAGLYNHAVLGDCFASIFLTDRAHGLVRRPYRTGINPLFHKGHFLFSKTVILLWRHFEIGILPANRLHEETLGSVTHHHDLVTKGIASGKQAFASHQIVIAVDILRIIAVTTVTLFSEQRLNLEREEAVFLAERRSCFFLLSFDCSGRDRQGHSDRRQLLSKQTY